MGLVSFRPRLLDSVRGYTRSMFLSDTLAGVVVAIVAALPLAIAFAVASGLSPEIGMITAIVGGFFVAVLGGCSVQIAGPTGSFIVIVYMVAQQYGVEGVMIATLLSGLMLLLMGALRLGSLIKFVPYPVVVGFTAGMAVVIFSTQINELLGLNIEGLPAAFVPKWQAFIGAIDRVHLPTMGIGLGSIALIYLSPRIIKQVPGSLVAIILMTVLVWALREFAGVTSIATISDRFTISGTLPTPSLPSWDFTLIAALAGPAFSIALIGAVESLLTASVVDSVAGDRHDSNTELIAQGIANIGVALMGGMPATGATARTMTNYNNGGRTPVAGIIHAIVLLLSFLFLMPLISYIPMACLAGVLVVVSIHMSGIRTIRSLLKGPRPDIVVLVVTFILTILFDLTVAIEVGLLLSMLFFMRRMVESTEILVSRDELSLSSIHDDRVGAQGEILSLPEGVEVYEIEGPYFFGIAAHFEELMASAPKRASVRILRMRFVPFMDSTAIHNLEMLCQSCHEEGVRLILSGVNERVRATLHATTIEQIIGEEHICPNIHQALAKASEYLTKE